MKELVTHTVLANGAAAPQGSKDPLVIDYRKSASYDRRLNVSLPGFVRAVYNLPDRVLDLLEIASYVFAVDRSFSRGRIDAVEYHSWSRSLQLVIRVRDFAFWSSTACTKVLSAILRFLTGDRDFEINFQPGHQTPPTGLFDDPTFHVDVGDHGIEVALFSGGIDSLAGAIDLLDSTKGKVILASHQSNMVARKTQQALVKALSEQYPDRIKHYPFQCNLHGKRATDETQRSRSFLFAAIAYALAFAYGQSSFNVYENGITSINLCRREDLLNARASRTTHPKTVAGFSEFFSLMHDKPFVVRHPFLGLTKGEVMQQIAKKHPNLISSTVSCTRAPYAKGEATHCGTCFQCIDRRLASFVTKLEDFDHRGLYSFDIVSQPLDHETKTVALDYIRQAISLDRSTADSFYQEYLYDISQMIDFLPFDGDEFDRVHSLWQLYKRHGHTVKEALSAIRTRYDDPFASAPSPDSLLDLLSTREYLKPDRERFIDALAPVLIQGIGEMFAKNRPKNEDDLNEKLGALLRSHDVKFRSEYPTVSFAGARVIPDHRNAVQEVLIEAKYIRDSTSPSLATEGIAADLTKYPISTYIVFLVYDPTHKIKSDQVFCEDIHSRGRNRVLIVR